MIQQSSIKLNFWEALTLLVLIICSITYSITALGVSPHYPIIFAILLLIVYSLIKKANILAILLSLKTAVPTIISASILFLLIGILISSWIIAGTIPTILYYSLSLVSASFFYATIFFITAIIGTVIGSSLTTVATLGAAFMTIASGFDLSLPLTAGAVVSGAFFGDKMSPLSDTTNLAASIVRIDLFTHIRNMLWTTIPAFIISIIAYAILSPSIQKIDTSFIETYRMALTELNLVHIYSLIPLVVLILCTFFKVAANRTLLISSISAIIISYFHSSYSFEQLVSIIYNGFTAHTGVETVDAFLTRGGMSSMYFTISLVILALILGNLLFTLGIIQEILNKVATMLQSIGQLITATALTAIGINILVGEQYLSLLLTGEMFKKKYAELQLHPKNLARVMEDAGTVVNPLLPWSVCGIFIMTVLNVQVVDYLPFAFFCLLSPILTITFGWLNITITKLDDISK